VRVLPVPCLSDNYAYLVICDATRRAAIVDPGEPGPVEEALAREGVELAAVWATHHHGDHIGGVADLVSRRPGLEVVASSHDRARVPHANLLVEDGDTVAMGEVTAKIILNPGHTLGAISFWIEGRAGETDDDRDGVVFTGDTLFAAGCGRLFEGTPAQMHTSLARLTALPPSTRIYFGHEYTASNLRFAAAVEPDSAEVARRAEAVAAARADGKPTTPSTVALERATNPFVRVDAATVQAAARRHDPTLEAGADGAAVLGVVRRWKDGFK